MEFRTERLLLRPARANDLEPMHAILGDPRAMAYWSSTPHENIGKTRDSAVPIPHFKNGEFLPASRIVANS